MNKKILTPELLEEYHKLFSETKASIDLPEEFFYIIATLIDREENIQITERVRKITENSGFDSVDEANAFIEIYQNYMNSVIRFIDHIETIKSSTEIEDISTEIFDKFYELNDYSNKKLIPVILSGAMSVVNLTLSMNEIEYSDDIDKFKSEIREKLGESYELLILTILSLSVRAEESPVGHSPVQSLFLITVVLVMNLNLLRKKKFIESRKISRECADVGRNDPCPCGSGLKFKKCCFLKM